MKKFLGGIASFIFGIAVICLYSSGILKIWMKSFHIALLLGGILICLCSIIEITFLFRKKRKVDDNASDDGTDRPKEAPHYERKREYVTKSELSFLRELKKIHPDKYEVLPQAALVNVIDKLTQNAYRNELFRVVDFLFVDARTYEPLLLVELNDRSHLKAERKERDRKVNEICESAGMPLITFWTNEEYSFSDIKKKVTRNILR